MVIRRMQIRAPGPIAPLLVVSHYSCQILAVTFLIAFCDRVTR
jgi:hypothetical protein